MNKISLGYLLTMLSALAFASLSLFAKLAYAVGTDAWSLTFINSAFALVLLGGMYLRGPKITFADLRQNRVSLAIFALCGAIGTIAFNLSLFYLPISLATILLFTYPAFVALGSWAILKQRPSHFYLAALTFALAGALLTANLPEAIGGKISLIGILLALCAAIAHALYMVVGERVTSIISPVGASGITRAMILLTVVVMHPQIGRDLGHVPTAGWVITLLSTLVAGVAPLLFLNRGVSLIGANRAAIASVVELPFALALGLLFQGDQIGPTQWMGALLIAAAVILSQRQRRVPA
jgi:DME family drug/metabolite transporter